MARLPRRTFLALGAAASCAPALSSAAVAASTSTTACPVVHMTDLFRPHGDPDDHWDLATLFALAEQGRIDLRAVFIDFPPPRRGNADPDVLAVAQLSYLTGIPVPVLVGSARQLQTRTELIGKPSGTDWRGILSLLRILRDSPRPVALHVVGTCNDVALASRLEPELFARKCAAVYLNAGSGTQDSAKRKKLEYNVALNPAAYAAVFDLPCPIYWLPCFEDANDFRAPAAYGSYFRFRHDAILPHLPQPLQNFFGSMYADGDQASRQQGPRSLWLKTLLGPRLDAVLGRQLPQFRNMWCTAGLLHNAGLAVAPDGQIVPLAQSGTARLYEFEPIRVRCTDSGLTEWHGDTTSQDRYILHVRDTQRYAAAMTAALRTLLAGLGRDQPASHPAAPKAGG